jgi:hypothetical protein
MNKIPGSRKPVDKNQSHRPKKKNQNTPKQSSRGRSRGQLQHLKQEDAQQPVTKRLNRSSVGSIAPSDDKTVPRTSGESHKRTQLTRQQEIELSIACFEGFNDPKTPRRKTIGELSIKCKEDWGLTPAPVTITRAIWRPFRKRWVKVERVWENTPPAACEPAPHLEKALKEKFPGLQNVIVLNIREAPDKKVAWPDDPFYQALGKAMAERIPGLLRPGDIVGVGSGRGVYNAVKFLENHPNLSKIPDLKLMSLTGRVWSKSSPGQPIALQMDADYHVSLMWGMCTSAQALYIGHPLSYPATSIQQGTVSGDEEKVVKAFRDQTPLSNWEKLRPGVALLGVGIVLSGHRFWVSSDTDKKSVDPYLRPVFDDLRGLVSLFENEGEVRAGKYSPVADTSNHLFYVRHPDPAVSKKFEHLQGKILQAIEKVNDKLLTISDAQLKDIPSIWLIAGSDEKIFAIRALLNNSNYKITFLCTDATAAKKLLEF